MSNKGAPSQGGAFLGSNTNAGSTTDTNVSSVILNGKTCDNPRDEGNFPRVMITADNGRINGGAN